MRYVQPTPNPSGAYPAPKSRPFPGAQPLSDAQAKTLLEYNGFVSITETDDGVVTVTPNTEAWEVWKAEQPDPSILIAEEVRQQRNTLLSETDWTQLNDAPLTDKEKEKYRTYRQALRDIPQQESFPENITWPTIE